MTTYVAVVGSGSAPDHHLALAEEVGALVAGSGAVLVCGGLGGVMSAACRGAVGAGGVTVGLLPGGDRSAANPFLTVAVPTGLGEARNALVVRAADVVIAVGGGWGTLSELALAKRQGVPVVLLDSWSVATGGHEEPLGIPAERATRAVEVALGLVRGAPESSGP
jgi:uncharacterized protein (TIGR00725 family)